MDVGLLGLLVDGSGARREIKLTREELIALANGARDMPALLKGAIPPAFVPPNVPPQINRITDAIMRMRAAAGQSTATAFGAQLATQMNMAEQSAMKLQRGLEGVRAAQQRMQTSASQSQANAMASQIQKLDPFQQQLGNSAVAASGGVGKLRGAITQLALSASGIPGPVGRMASVLSQFAFGGATTVAVIGGITLMAYAWDKFTESGDRARALMRDVHQMESGFSLPAQRARIGELSGSDSRLSAQLDLLKTPYQSGLPGLSEVMNLFNMREASKVEAELADVRERRLALTNALRRAEADLARETKDANDDRVRMAAQSKTQWGLGGLIDLAKAKSPWDPNAGNLQTLALAKERNEYDAINASIEARRQVERDGNKEALAGKLEAIQKEKEYKDAIADGNYELAKRLTTERQKAGAKLQVAQYALSLGSRAGAFGEGIAGIGSNLLMGNPYAAAASGITGLVGGLLDLGGASSQAREALRQFQVQFASYTDSLKLSLGDITQGQFDINEFKRQNEEQRRRIYEQYTLDNPVERAKALAAHKPYYGTLSEEGQRKLDQLNELERRRIEALGKEADAIDRINSAVRNAPAGYYVEKYLRRLGAAPVTSSGWEGVGPTPTTLGSSTNTSTGVTGGVAPTGPVAITMVPGAILINGNLPPLAMAQSLIEGLQQIAATTGGTGMTLAQALEMVH